MPHLTDTITTADGDCAVALFTPDGTGPWPGAVMYPDAGGVRATFEDMAAELAGLGYAVLLPDFYYRHPGWAPFDMATAFNTPGERGRIMALMRSITAEVMVADAAAFFDYLAGRPEVAGERFGVCGYCMGGRTALTVAGRLPERVAAAASFHGGHLVTDKPDSPHLLAERMRARVYVAGAHRDAAFTKAQAATLEQALSAAGVVHTVEFYDAEHGFAVPDNPTFDAAAAQRHWAALEQVFGAALRD